MARMQPTPLKLRSDTFTRTVDAVAADCDDAHEAVRP